MTSGLYSLPTTQGGEWTMDFGMDPGYASFYGGVLYNDMYYATRCNAQYGSPIVYVDAYSMEDGSKQWTNYPKVTELPYDLTYNPYDGKIYGLFSNSDNSGMVLATITYDKAGETLTPIKEMEGVWVAIAAAPSGELYGILSDVEGSGTSVKVNSSSLYKIDRLTGVTTLVGETGQFPLLTGSATIDARSGRMFWTVGPGDDTTFLCEVNLTTGKATKIMDFDQAQQVVGLYVPTPPAEDDAPAEVTDMIASFEKGSLSGTISFKAPTTLYDGTPATGDITYTILVNGSQQATGTTTFGATVNETVTVPERGNYEFTISVANDKGASPKAGIECFIGFGVPNAPEGVKAVQADGKITVSWDAVTTSADGGYVDAGAVTYTVKRMPGEVTVKEGVTATSVEDIPETAAGIAAYSYQVTADNHGCVSDASESNRVVCGTAALPWQEDFSNAGTFDFFTVIDANDDGKTWEYTSGAARVKYGRVDMDDWLMTPPVNLEAGKVYYASFKAHSSNARYPEKIEAKWGAGNSVADMTNTLVEPTTLSGDYETLGGFIMPAVSGTYHVGLHGISAADMYNLEVCEIKIDEGISANAPEAPTDLAVTPAALGEYKATIRLKAPVKNMAGQDLTAIDKIELTRNGVNVHTFANPAPGEELTYDDILEASGDYTYSAYAVNGADEGFAATGTAFVGTPVAAAPDTVIISETAPGMISLSWDKVALSADGAPINPEKVTYNIYKNNTYTTVLIAENVSEIPYVFKGVEEGTQEFVQYSVSAVTDCGESEKTQSRTIPAGTAYTDFHESYAGGQASTIYTTERINYGNWAVQTDNAEVTAEDGDGGFMAMTGYFAGYCGAMTTGKISLSGTVAPTLRFYSYTPDNSGLDLNTLVVCVSSNGGEWAEVLNKTVVEMGAEQGWHEVVVPLSAYAGTDVSLRFMATTHDRPYTSTYIDNLKIDDITGAELGVTGIEAPDYVKAGQTFNVKVSLKNNGSMAAHGVNIDLYADDAVCSTISGKDVERGEATSVEFAVVMSPLSGKTVGYKAVVSHPDDVMAENNTSEVVTVNKVAPQVPVPTNLTAITDGSSVSLKWNAPALATEPDAAATDDFESTEAWGHCADGWVMRDMDKSPVAGFVDFDIPGIEINKTTASFFTFSSTAFGGNTSLKAHSGNQYIAALARYDQGTTDDWAISPELSGKAQTVSFYARSLSAGYPEHIEVLYSTKTFEAADFTAAGLDVDAVPGEWTRYEVALPEGARYFAIRSCATNSFMLMIDDVTFVPLASGNLELVGYNVYRNNELINEQPVTATEYVDNATAGENNKWVVTAVYGQCESGGSNEASAVSSVDGVTDGGVVVKTIPGGIRIIGCCGKAVSAWSADGKLVYSATGKAVTDIAVEKGVYVVKAGGVVRKLVVGD